MKDSAPMSSIGEQEAERKAGIESARDLAHRAESQRDAGHIHDALALADKASAEFARWGGRGGRAAALNLAGQLAGRLGKTAVAIERFDEAKAVCVASGQMIAAAVCDREAGVLLERIGQTHKAKARIMLARDNFRSSADVARADECDAIIARLGSHQRAGLTQTPTPKPAASPMLARPDLVPRTGIRELSVGVAQRRIIVGTGVLLVLALVGWFGFQAVSGGDAKKVISSSSVPSGGSTKPGNLASTTLASPVQPGIWADPALVGQPYPGSAAGMISFRGNPTRTYYGKGPVPKKPKILWQYPKGAPMCSESTDKQRTVEWCGQGWTGQVNVFNFNGKRALAFGAYDRKIHVADALTGDNLLDPFTTGDLTKGTVTVDPDGFPLLYSGSRDNNFRIFSLDNASKKITELWHTNAQDVQPTLWNDDWDSSPLIINDYILEGGENSQWYVIKINRGYDAAGKVTVNPQIVFHAPGWDDAQLTALDPKQADKEVSIENSLALYGHTVYFANSGGLVQGWDLTGVETGATPKQTFRFWTGEDTDASIVIDAAGMLYVNTESERKNARSKIVGNILKLNPAKYDPANPDASIVWSHPYDDAPIAGFWSTPALFKDVLIAAETRGQLIGFDAATGSVRWTKTLPAAADVSFWASPVVVDNTLIMPDGTGVVHAYDVTNTLVDPPELWTVKVPNAGQAMEATPVVYDGKIYIGSRSGYLYCLG